LGDFNSYHISRTTKIWELSWSANADSQGRWTGESLEYLLNSGGYKFCR